MKTNFEEWYQAYYLVLLPYYNSFTPLFINKTPPTMKDFMYYCFINTKKTYNDIRSRHECYIPNF